MRLSFPFCVFCRIHPDHCSKFDIILRQQSRHMWLSFIVRKSVALFRLKLGACITQIALVFYMHLFYILASWLPQRPCIFKCTEQARKHCKASVSTAFISFFSFGNPQIKHLPMSRKEEIAPPPILYPLTNLSHCEKKGEG